MVDMAYRHSPDPNPSAPTTRLTPNHQLPLATANVVDMVCQQTVVITLSRRAIVIFDELDDLACY